MKYHSVITHVGSDALHFLKEDVPFIILFDETVPAELAEIAVLHQSQKLLAPIGPGDTVLLGEKVYDVTAVGDSVNQTMEELGHCTLCFKASDVPDRPGCIMLGGDEAPEADDFQDGVILEIH
ncbi:PTS glucitol/sorbitol transporter subunit IIA [Megasphaera hexanoica]|uniref:PTS glucitol/sorbitol transporter subunit IIA n=1 Tax=Megasphaera hexanoica TaxID=1675036 RepID=A0ABW7DQD5_9FIRM|nr:MULTISPECIES: PTS glucitol/sorbitol transporter subunit IIA [Megasphaera]AXB81937.1 hypothetical protein ACT01_06640 [Megasphaera hexanoica]